MENCWKAQVFHGWLNLEAQVKYSKVNFLDLRTQGYSSPST
jgi:hypothetical protein